MKDLIKVEQNQQGELVVDSRLISEELGIQHKSLLKTIKKHIEILERKSPARLKVLVTKRPQGGTYEEKYYYLGETQTCSLLSVCRNGLSEKAIGKFKEQYGWDLGAFTETTKKRKRKKESDYSNLLALDLGGQREIQTLAGNIDVLTFDEIIEVKDVSMWKHALGQVLVYGYYYPSHKKRIHLYGETQESFLKMIESHCERFRVRVTWEY